MLKLRPLYPAHILRSLILASLQAEWWDWCMHEFGENAELKALAGQGSDVCKKLFMAAALNEVHPFLRHTCLCADDEYLPNLEE